MTPHAVARSVEALPHRLDDAHVPDLPAWICQDCLGGTPWPCPPARIRLAEAYGLDRAGLAAYVGTLLFVAAGDLPQTPAVELHERFVAWTR